MITLFSGSCKVEMGRGGIGIDGDGQSDRRAVVHVIDRSERLAFSGGMGTKQECANGRFGVGGNSTHVEMDGVDAMLCDKICDQSSTLGVRGYLSFEVIEVISEIAGTAAAREFGRVVEK
jgi:hypothetical protein